jgi:serine/threonine protein kinase
MAPEVARAAPYNQSVDVYSFGILLWELCSGERAFGRSSRGNLLCQVVFGGDRPPMDAKRTEYWPANLVRLIQRCWASSPGERPSFDVILEVLQDILDGNENVPIALELHSSNMIIKVDRVREFSFRRKKKATNVVTAKA